MPNYREKGVPSTKGFKVLEPAAEDGAEDLSTEGDFEIGPRTSTVSRGWATLKSVACSPAGRIMAGLALIALAMPLILDFGARSRVSRRPANKCYGGTSTAQAKELGCEFDPMAPAWLPAECRHEELTAAFERAGSLHEPEGRWRYFSDQNMTNEVSTAQVAAMADSGDAFHASYNWHVMHCMFLWQKRELAIEGKVVLEERYDNLLHAQHCTHAFWSGSASASRVLLGGSNDILQELVPKLIEKWESRGDE